MKINLKTVAVFQAIDRHGVGHMLTKVGDEWNGMLELQDITGRKLIVHRTASAMSEVLTNVLGDGTTEWAVVSCSPSLMQDLGILPNPKQPETVPVGSQAVIDVLAERAHQVAIGRDAEHDDAHDAAELAVAAAELLADGTDCRVVYRANPATIPELWGLRRDLAGNRRRQLVVAAALALAEIERFDRAAKVRRAEGT